MWVAGYGLAGYLFGSSSQTISAATTAWLAATAAVIVANALRRRQRNRPRLAWRSGGLTVP